MPFSENAYIHAFNIEKDPMEALENIEI